MVAKLLLFPLLAFTLMAPATAAAADPQPRIVGGTAASAGEYPAQAYVQVETPDGIGACGGTVIGERQVLTAAHCTVDDSTGDVLAPAAFLIVLGENVITAAEVDDPAEIYGVTGVDVHEAYGSDPSGVGNDLAMLTLDRDAFPDPANPEVGRMLLVGPSETSLWDPGTSATIVGWGTTSSGGPSSDDLLEAQVPIVEDQDCVDAYTVDPDGSGPGGPIPIDPDTMVCAGDGVHDTCQGDSGGPLMVPDSAATDLVLAGVTSFGNDCADPDYPGVYVRLGAPALNAWVRGRLYSVNFSQAPAFPTAGQPVGFAATAAQGGGFVWDFDGDGQFDASGASVTHTFPAAGVYRVVLRATDPEGQPAERVRTVTVAARPPVAAGGSGPDLTLPLVSASLSSRVFAVDRGGAPERPVGAARKGTTFRYRLSEDARVVFTIERALPGRRSGRRCVKPTRRNRGKRKCTRYQRFGRFAQASKAQSNSKRYSGRIGRKAMKPGSFRATLVATDAAGNRSKPKRLALRVVRR